MPVWFGGRSEAALRRVGMLGDGWLGSAVSPEEVRAVVPRVHAIARAAGREIEGDHFGVIVPYWITPDRGRALERVAPGLLRLRPDGAPADYAALGTAAEVRALLDRFVAAGASKFVLRPVCPPDETFDQLDRLAADVLPAFHAAVAA
jgi:alkanesulfonate monooxygenase SsuD/methylene tetrahydromethanopterin reductase-like flavin-dependent oxidoreductase (luciferase family)